MITRKELDKLAVKLAKDHWKRDQWNIEYFDVKSFSHTLLLEVQKQLEPKYFAGTKVNNHISI